MKAYVVVRKDLSPSQIAVQASHALVELSHNHDVSIWAKSHKTIVILGVNNFNKLEYFYHNLLNKKKAIFYEPDINNEPTAIAFLAEEFEPITKKLNLLKKEGI